MYSILDINDDGFWDVRKGWTLPVSGCIIARNRWREAFKFSTCKSCRGVGGYVAKAVLLYKELINKNSVLYDKIDEKKDECNKDDSISHRNSSSQFIIKNNNNSNNDNNNNNDDNNNNIENNINNNNANNNNNNDHNIKIINDDLRRSSSSVVSSTFLSTSTSTSTYQTAATMRRQAAIVAATMVDTKHRLIWKIPDLLSSFLSNLPINLCGITPYNRSWVIRQLYQILNLKLTNDKMDSDMGTGVQVSTYIFYIYTSYQFIYFLLFFISLFLLSIRLPNFCLSFTFPFFRFFISLYDFYCYFILFYFNCNLYLFFLV